MKFPLKPTLLTFYLLIICLLFHLNTKAQIELTEPGQNASNLGVGVGLISNGMGFNAHGSAILFSRVSLGMSGGLTWISTGRVHTRVGIVSPNLEGLIFRQGRFLPFSVKAGIAYRKEVVENGNTYDFLVMAPSVSYHLHDHDIPLKFLAGYTVAPLIVSNFQSRGLSSTHIGRFIHFGLSIVVTQDQQKLDTLTPMFAYWEDYLQLSFMFRRTFF